MVIQWTTTARQQLKHLFGYYQAAANKQVARRIVGDIEQSTDLLATFPLMGAVEPALEGLPSPFRSWVVERRFKVVYYIDEAHQKVVIATVFDCRQNPEKLKDEISKR
jgi:plasmid stabilization system protein ParE